LSQCGKGLLDSLRSAVARQKVDARTRISQGRLAIELAKVTEEKSGNWCQGSAWRKDSRLVILQCMVEQTLTSYSFNGKKLAPIGTIKTKGGPGGIGAALN